MKNLHRSALVMLYFFITLNVTAQVPLLSSYPSSPSVVFLDFDGQTVTGTSWNLSGPIYCGASGLNAVQITEVFNRVAEDYRPFNINITTDSTIFLAAAPEKRMRVIITVSSAWYGSAAGVAFVGSFTWGDDTPCFVFSATLSYNVKYVSEASSHESGHTLGLYHQSSYDANCIKTSEYNYGQGVGETGWAPIMGAGYYQNFTVWHNGPDPFGCAAMQNDFAVIAGTLGANALRNDDFSNTFSTASELIFINHQFLVNGFIETHSDSDLFKFTIPYAQHLVLNATPYNLGANNAGSDLDIEISLFNTAGQLIKTYNPPTILSAVIDTILGPGLYYLRVHGTGNLYASNYGSLGSYSLQASLSDFILPLHRLLLRGRISNGKHELNWIVEADEEVVDQRMQISSDGINFAEIATVPRQDRTFVNSPAFTSTAYYRLSIVLSNREQYYSNIVALNAAPAVSWPALVTTMVTNDCSVNSPGVFSFSIYTSSGQVIFPGHLAKGVSIIPTSNLAKGIYIIQFSAAQGNYAERFLKQ